MHAEIFKKKKRRKNEEEEERIVSCLSHKENRLVQREDLQIKINLRSPIIQYKSNNGRQSISKSDTNDVQ